jgi:peptidoglycan/LPS O-acetylase OafA/YrhL
MRIMVRTVDPKGILTVSGHTTAACDRIDAYDGLRFVAFLGVYGFHATQAWPSIWYWMYFPGSYGVQTFFVLSGYLIGRMVLELRKKSEVSLISRLASFYIGRCLRIFPAFYTTLLIYALFINLGAKNIGSISLLPWHAVYLTNVRYWIDRSWPGGQSHLWTLSVEEQFYVVAPLLMIRLSNRTLTICFACIWLFCAIARACCWTEHDDFTRLLMPMQADTLTVGMAAAVIVGEGSFMGITARQIRSIAPVLWITALVTVLNAHPSNHSLFGLVSQVSSQWIFACAVASLIMDLSTNRDTFASRTLSGKVMVRLGRISYGLYLFHLLYIELFRSGPSWFEKHPLAAVIAAFPVTVITAELSMRFIEQPFLRLRTTNRVTSV